MYILCTNKNNMVKTFLTSAALHKIEKVFLSDKGAKILLYCTVTRTKSFYHTSATNYMITTFKSIP